MNTRLIQIQLDKVKTERTLKYIKNFKENIIKNELSFPFPADSFEEEAIKSCNMLCEILEMHLENLNELIKDITEFINE